MLRQAGSLIFITEEKVEQFQRLSDLGPRNWQLHYDENRRMYYLSEINMPEINHKIYGNAESLTDRYLKTYLARQGKNLGILLAGLKGTGKTIAGKLLSLKTKRPIINITQGYSGEAFMSFLTRPELAECVIFIDEFEKLYQQPQHQKDFLQIMDGSLSNNQHQLFIFTVNQDNLNEYMKNRPGRLWYMEHYNMLTEEEIREILLDILVDQTKLEDTVDTLSEFGYVTYDILSSVVYDMNLHNESAKQCMNKMALSTDEAHYYDVFEEYAGVVSECNPIYTKNVEATCFDDNIRRIGNPAMRKYVLDLNFNQIDYDELQKLDEKQQEEYRAKEALHDFLTSRWIPLESFKDEQDDDGNSLLKFTKQGRDTIVTVSAIPNWKLTIRRIAKQTPKLWGDF